MQPYVADKARGSLKFDGWKYNSKVGFATITPTSKLEARNANRSRKKAMRQQLKKQILQIDE